jgi:H+/Cl- antiporter ClcA
MSSAKNKIINLFKWIFICSVVGILIGSATAFFLLSLDFVTKWRGDHFWIIYTLPIVGLIIGLMYYYYGGHAKKGNNLILEAHQNQEQKIPFKMAPLVFVGTILTHLAGGSAGREGTAVQMGGAIADQFTSLFKLNESQRKTILIIGISAGFAAVFGTPIAGAIFALEIMLFKNCRVADIIPCIVTAYIAHYTCLAWGIHHTIYNLPPIANFNIHSILPVFLAGLIFGITALLFSNANVFWSKLFKKIKFEPLRPFIGGIILVIAILLLGTSFNSAGDISLMNNKFLGLGIPTISNSFINQVGHFDFLIKLLLTTFTLSAGFKGGEVTPLFFIGATLGNVLFLFIPLPMALLAGMGFVAVFAGATHAALTGIVLGIEMFGFQAGVYIGLASVVAYFSSGTNGIYSSQIKQGAKYKLYNFLKSRIIGQKNECQ